MTNTHALRDINTPRHTQRKTDTQTLTDRHTLRETNTETLSLICERETHRERETNKHRGNRYVNEWREYLRMSSFRHYYPS